MSRPVARTAWFTWGWVCAAVLAAALVLLARIGVVVCDGVLRLEPEPGNWRSWRLGAGGLGIERGEVTGPGVCPSGRVSLASWFAGTDDGRVRGMPWLRSDEGAGVVVVAGAPLSAEAPRERFILALARHPTTRVAFTSTPRAMALGLVGASLATMLTGLGLAYRRRRAAWSPDGGSLSAGPGSYRDPPEAPPTRERDRSALPEAYADRAVRPIRVALIAVAALLGIGLIGGGLFILGEVLRVVL